LYSTEYSKPTFITGKITYNKLCHARTIHKTAANSAQPGGSY